jgi:DNA-binding response OmpR family regulator
MSASKILLAEDEEHIAKLVLFKFGKAGLDCVWAKNGLEALEQARSGQYDLLILDIMMPGLDGWSVLKSLADEELKPFPRVIMLSARGFQHDLGVSARLGIKHYLKKPFDLQQMLDAVQKVLAEPLSDG